METFLLVSSYAQYLQDRLASVRVELTDLAFVEHPGTLVLGVVCDLPRARVNAEKYTVVLRSASVRT